MMPTWVRILLTIIAGAWMAGWIVVCGRMMIKYLAELMGEDDEDKKKTD